MIHRLLKILTVLGYNQPPLDYCANCGGHYPPSHFPCR